jgi:Ca-activated chloride channel family protein
MKKIVFMLIPLLVTLLAFSPVNSFTVKGVVKDDNGKIVSYATVTEKGTKNSVSADSNGAFTIQVKSEKAILVISAIGHVSKEVKVKGQSTINVALNVSKANLEEVVVVGYGAETKTDATSNFGVFNKALGVPGGGRHIQNKQFYQLQDNNGYLFDSTIDFNTESYDKITEDPFLRVTDNPLSTFSIDVDAASYSNIRRFLNNGELPPAGAVRIEEMINYFHYEYPQPNGDDPFSVNTEISDCPWNKDHKLVLVGLQGKQIPVQNLPPSNLVFLIDVSGSMMTENKLPLVKASMKLLVDQLRQDDKVAIVVYAGAAGLALPSTNGSDKIKIKDAIEGLEAGGSTAGGAGIKLAYKTAAENFVKGGNNRVILCTDGDF